MQLQVEGGAVLAKNGSGLDEYDVRDGSQITVEMVEKVNTSTPRERKPKEESKVTVKYSVRGSGIQEKVEVPRSLKVKQLRKILLQEIGMEGQASLKIYQGE